MAVPFIDKGATARPIGRKVNSDSAVVRLHPTVADVARPPIETSANRSRTPTEDQEVVAAARADTTFVVLKALKARPVDVPYGGEPAPTSMPPRAAPNVQRRVAKLRQLRRLVVGISACAKRPRPSKARGTAAPMADRPVAENA